MLHGYEPFEKLGRVDVMASLPFRLHQTHEYRQYTSNITAKKSIKTCGRRSVLFGSLLDDTTWINSIGFTSVEMICLPYHKISRTIWHRYRTKMRQTRGKRDTMLVCIRKTQNKSTSILVVADMHYHRLHCVNCSLKWKIPHALQLSYLPKKM